MRQMLFFEGMTPALEDFVEIEDGRVQSVLDTRTSISDSYGVVSGFTLTVIPNAVQVGVGVALTRSGERVSSLESGGSDVPFNIGDVNKYLVVRYGRVESDPLVRVLDGAMFNSWANDGFTYLWTAAPTPATDVVLGQLNGAASAILVNVDGSYVGRQLWNIRIQPDQIGDTEMDKLGATWLHITSRGTITGTPISVGRFSIQNPHGQVLDDFYDGTNFHELTHAINFRGLADFKGGLKSVLGEFETLLTGTLALTLGLTVPTLTVGTILPAVPGGMINFGAAILNVAGIVTGGTITAGVLNITSELSIDAAGSFSGSLQAASYAGYHGANAVMVGNWLLPANGSGLLSPVMPNETVVVVAPTGKVDFYARNNGVVNTNFISPLGAGFISIPTRLADLTDPVADQDAVTKHYVDTATAMAVKYVVINSQEFPSGAPGSTWFQFHNDPTSDPVQSLTKPGVSGGSGWQVTMRAGTVAVGVMGAYVFGAGNRSSAIRSYTGPRNAMTSFVWGTWTDHSGVADFEFFLFIAYMTP